MTDKKWLVPDVIDPAEKVCVQLEIPNDIKHIAAFWGALEQLSKAYNWEDSFADGSQTAYVWRDVIADASELVKTGVNCMLDCDDVEVCLATSPIITTIETNIVINETDIINNETNITNNVTNITNITEGGIDTNVFPDLPTLAEPDLLCGAAYRIAQEVIDFVEQTVIDVILIAQDAWVLGILFLGSWEAIRLMVFFDYVLGNEPSLNGVDFDVYLDQLAEAFYCAELDIVQAIADLDPAIPELHRTAMILSFQGITFAQVALWAFVGGLDDSHDCGSFCGTWCRKWDVSTGFGDWTVLEGVVDGIGLRTVVSNPGGYEINRFKLTMPKLPTATRIILFYEWDGYKSQNSFAHEWLTLPDTTSYGHNHMFVSESDVPGDISRDIPYDGTLGAGIITVLGASGADVTPPLDTGGYNCWLVSVEIQGDGANPFGADNC